MAISKEEVEHIAKLSRLELSGKEIEKMQKDLSSILDYFDLLKKAPKPTKILEVQNSVWQAKSLRSDVVKTKDEKMAEKIIAGFPESKDGYNKVKTIL